jgi:hypothetical protein|tara:strand:- start:141 stop:386 length:246 start_codon:yes stop_codon:yes gene_type:complete
MSKRKIKKLTPELIKRIIAEEKEKIILERQNVKKSRKQSSINKQIKFLNETKDMQRELVEKFKKLYRLRSKIKKNIIKQRK